MSLELRDHRAYWNGEQVGLTYREVAVVRHLAGRPGADVTYREVFDAARGNGFVAGLRPPGYRQNVRSFIKRIRRKFRDLDSEFQAIENYAGYGYCWQKVE